LLATWTKETARGSASIVVINQAEAASEIAMPVRDNDVAAQITAKGRCEKGPRRGLARDIADIRYAP
jgi:hypothetical protein